MTAFLLSKSMTSHLDVQSQNGYFMASWLFNSSENQTLWWNTPSTPDLFHVSYNLLPHKQLHWIFFLFFLAVPLRPIWVTQVRSQTDLATHKQSQTSPSIIITNSLCIADYDQPILLKCDCLLQTMKGLDWSQPVWQEEIRDQNVAPFLRPENTLFV